MDVGAGLRLDYRLRLWATTSASRAVSVVAELLVSCLIACRIDIACSVQ